MTSVSLAAGTPHDLGVSNAHQEGAARWTLSTTTHPASSPTSSTGGPTPCRADVAVNDAGKDSQLTGDDLAKVDHPGLRRRRPDGPHPSHRTRASRASSRSGAKEGHGIGRAGRRPRRHARGRRRAEPRPRRVARSSRSSTARCSSTPGSATAPRADPFWTDARVGPDALGALRRPRPGTGLRLRRAGPGRRVGHARRARHLPRRAGAPDRAGGPRPRRAGDAQDGRASTTSSCTARSPGWSTGAGAPRTAAPSSPSTSSTCRSASTCAGPSAIPEDDPLLASIRALGDLGVRVVTSAGNRATQRPGRPGRVGRDDEDDRRPRRSREPAALRCDGEHTALVTVGALDPDGQPAMYSNTGDWVRAQAPGTASGQHAADVQRGRRSRTSAARQGRR